MVDCLEKFGRIDFLVNNGGGQFTCPVADMSLKVISIVIQVNNGGGQFPCPVADRYVS